MWTLFCLGNSSSLCNSLPLPTSSSSFPSFLRVISLPDFLRLYLCWGASILLQRGQFIPTGGNENTNLTVHSSQTPSRSAVLMSSPVCRDYLATVQVSRCHLPSRTIGSKIQSNPEAAVIHLEGRERLYVQASSPTQN